MSFTAAALGMMAVGQTASAVSAYKANKYNAAVAEQEAEQTMIGARLVEVQKRRQLRQDIGEQVAGYARAGVTFTGSPIQVMVNDLANAELDIAIGNYNSEIQAQSLRSEAEISKMQARQSLYQGVTQVSGTLLTGMANQSVNKVGTKVEKIGSYYGVRK